MRLIALVVFIVLTSLASPAFAGEAVIFNGDYVKALKAKFKLSETAYVVTGTADPTAVAQDAPKGSLYMRQTPAGDGAVYVKKDDGSSTNWDMLTTTAGPILTANRAVVTDAAGSLTASATTDTQIGYLSGATGTTGTNALVYGTSPTLVTPDLGTPSAATLTNATGLPLTTGVTGTLPVANGGTGVTTSTGTTNVVLSNSPTLVTPDLGTPSAATLTNATGLPLTTGVTGTLGVGNGGTGTTTNTNHGVLLGQGAGAIAATAAGTTGQVLTGVTGSDPIWAAPATSGTVTSIDVSGGTTGLTTSGGPVTGSGTITIAGTLSAANGGTGVANNAAATLTRTGNHDLALTTTAATALTLPTSGTVATLAGTEAFTNKDYAGGTASNTNRLTVPNASFSTIDATTDKTATMAYDTTSGNMLVNDGTNWKPTGSAYSTSGLKNYIIAGANNATGWTASGAGITVATTTTAADLPRNITTLSGIAITPVSGTTDYVQYCWTIDSADVSTKLQLQFNQLAKSGYASNDVEVRVYSFASANCGSTATRLPLSTDTSAPLSGLPNLTGLYTTTFDTTTTLNYGVRFYRTAGTTAIVLSDFYVGPGQTPQSAVVEYLGNIGITTNGFGTIANSSFKGWRRGNMLKVQASFQAGTVAASVAKLTLPTGMTVDSAALSSNQDSPLGYFTRSASGAGQAALNGNSGVLFYDISAADTTAINISTNVNGSQDGTYTAFNGSSIFATSDGVMMYFEVPIAEWAGQGTVNVAFNGCEYVYNTTAFGTANTTAFGYGPVGAAFGASPGNEFAQRVRFQYPIGKTDFIEIQVDPINSGVWIPALGAHPTGSNKGSIVDYNHFGTPGTSNAFGLAYLPVSGSTTDLDVLFGRYYYTTTDNAASGDWSDFSANSGRWRVAHCPPGQAVGFGLASTTSNGLIAGTGTQTIGGRITGGNSKVRVARNSNQSISDSTDVVVIFNSETLDTNSEYNTSNGLFTASAAGYYNIQCNVYFDDTLTSSQTARIGIQKNGSSVRLTPNSFPSTQQPNISTFDLIQLSAGDTLACYVYQNSGSSKNIQGSDTTRTVMTINQLF